MGRKLYTQKSLSRPKNINIIEEIQKLIVINLKIINLLDWDEQDIKKYTVDNMHLSYEGSEYLYNKITLMVENLLFQNKES